VGEKLPARLLTLQRLRQYLKEIIKSVKLEAQKIIGSNKILQ
jgi:hypothetical protein